MIPAVAVDAAGVAERQRHQAGPDERVVGPPDGLAQVARPTPPSLIRALQPRAQVVVRLVPAELLAERRHGRRPRRSAAARRRPSRRSRPAARVRGRRLRTVWCAPPALEPRLDARSAGRVAAATRRARPAAAAAPASASTMSMTLATIRKRSPRSVMAGDERRTRAPRRTRAGPGRPCRRSTADGSRSAAGRRRSSGRPRACARRGPSAPPGRGRTCSPP